MANQVANKSNEITPTFRISLKSNQRLVVWQVASESGHTYNVSLLDGKVTGCQDENENDCPSFHSRHSCHHATMAQARENERSHAEERRYRAPLNRRELRMENGVPMR